jgi:hypothetical protein
MSVVGLDWPQKNCRIRIDEKSALRLGSVTSPLLCVLFLISSAVRFAPNPANSAIASHFDRISRTTHYVLARMKSRRKVYEANRQELIIARCVFFEFPFLPLRHSAISPLLRKFICNLCSPNKIESHRTADFDILDVGRELHSTGSSINFVNSYSNKLERVIRISAGESNLTQGFFWPFAYFSQVWLAEGAKPYLSRQNPLIGKILKAAIWSIRQPVSLANRAPRCHSQGTAVQDVHKSLGSGVTGLRAGEPGGRSW